MRSRKAKALTSLILAGVLCLPAWADVNPKGLPPQQGPQPGMLNYIEGQASIGGQALAQNSAGAARLQAGQSLATQNGRVELLLTPGVLLRLDNNSAVQMNSPNIPDTEVTVQGGRAMVEVDQILPANHILIHEGAATVQLMKNGLYDFDTTSGRVRVFEGRATATVGGRNFTIQDGHQFDINAAKPKANGFDKKASEDNFYRWGSLRSSYLAEANADAARGFGQGYYGQGNPGNGYAGYGYPGYYAGAYDPGWFWDPYFDAYTWLPYDGIFFSPFGWGFYSPGFWRAAPFYGRGGYHNFGPGYRPSPAAVQTAASHASGSTQGRVGGNSFAGGGARVGGFSGGGFHGGGGFSGGGGFHGGGGGGGGGHR